MRSSFASCSTSLQSNSLPVGIEEIDLNRSPALIGVGRPIQTNHRIAVAVTQRQQLVDQPAGQAHDAGVNQIDPDRLDPLETDFDRRQAQIVDGAILKARRAGRQIMVERHDRGKGDRAARIPGTPQFLGGSFAHQQTAHARRVAEDFVKRDIDEVRMPAAEIQPVGGRKGRRIQQHIPAFRLAPARSIPADAAHR